MSIQSPLSTGPRLPEAWESLRKNWWLMLLCGIALLAIGSFAIVYSIAATLTTMMVFGVLLAVGGGVHIASAFMARHWRGFFLHLLAGVLYLITGTLIIERPLMAAEMLTLLMAAVLTIGGLFRILVALVERFPAWGWVLLNGVITLILGVIIWRQWPWSGLSIIGLFVGIEMIFSGWAWVMLAMALRSGAAR